MSLKFEGVEVSGVAMPLAMEFKIEIRKTA